MSHPESLTPHDDIIESLRVVVRRRARRSAFAAAVAALLTLTACSTIDQHTPAPHDWPRLAVRVHERSTADMLAQCWPMLPLVMKLLGAVPVACAKIDFERRTCDIERTAWTPGLTIAHEHEHCAGKDHPGESTLRDAFDTYKRSRP